MAHREKLAGEKLWLEKMLKPIFVTEDATISY